MNLSDPNLNGVDLRVSRALQEFRERTDRGESVDREAFIGRDPEIADPLRAALARSDVPDRSAAMENERPAQTIPPKGASLEQNVAEFVERGEFKPALDLLDSLVAGEGEKRAEWARQQQKRIREQMRLRKNGVETLCLVAAKLIRKHDYAEATNVLSNVPVGERTDELNELLSDATEKETELSLLLKDIEQAILNNQPKELPALVKRFLQLKPGNKFIKQLSVELDQYGPERVIRLRQRRQHFLDPAGQVWNPLQIAYYIGGLALTCVSIFLATMAFSSPSGTVIIEVHDPSLRVTFANKKITAVSSGKRFRLKTTERNELHFEIAGIAVESSAQVISVEKNETKIVSARLVNGKLVLAINSQQMVFAVPDQANSGNVEPPITEPLPVDHAVQLANSVPDGWSALFNGTDLIGWEGNRNFWTVKDGVIVGEAESLEQPQYLLTEMEYSNFELRLQFRLLNDGNSGVQYRTTVNRTTVSGSETKLFGDGHEADIGFEVRAGEEAKNLVGDIWGFIWGLQQERLVEAQGQERTDINTNYRHRDWNELVVRCLEGHEVIELNGVKTAEIKQSTGPKSGRIGFQLHGKTPTKIEFRDVRIHLLDSPSSPAPPSSPQAPASKPSMLLLDVDFRKSDGGFFVGDEQRILAAHQDGEYRYLGKSQGWAHNALHPVFFRKKNRQLRDFEIEVDIRIIGQKKGRFKIRFGRCGDGQYGLCLNQAGQIQLVEDRKPLGTPTVSPAMRPVDQFNTIRLSVEKKIARVWVNGTFLFEKRLERYAGDMVVLILEPDEPPFDTRLQRVRLERIGPSAAESPQLSTELRRFRGHTDVVRGIAFLPNGQRVVSVGHGKAFKLWDVETGQMLHDFVGHSSHVTSVSVSGDGLRALTGCDDGVLRLWDIENRTLLKSYKGHNGHIGSVLLTRDGFKGLSAATDNTIRQWDLRVGMKSKILPGPTVDPRLAISSSGNLVAAGNSDGTVVLRHPNRSVTLVGHAPGLIQGLAFSPDESKLVTGADDGTLRVWSVDNGKEVHRFETDGVSFGSVAITNNGRYVLAGSGDNSIVGWDLQTADKVVDIRTDMPVTQRLSLSPDNRYVMSGAGSRGWNAVGDFDLRLWKLPSPPGIPDQ